MPIRPEDLPDKAALAGAEHLARILCSGPLVSNNSKSFLSKDSLLSMLNLLNLASEIVLSL